jgi:hypothetical protein
MTPHRFRLGQTVTLNTAPFLRIKAGPYRITMLYPNDGPDREYRVQSLGEKYERVVRESEIQSVGSA